MSQHHFKYKGIYFSEGMFRTAMAMAEQSEREYETLTKQLEIAMEALKKVNNPEKCDMPRLIWNDIAGEALAEIDKLKNP